MKILKLCFILLVTSLVFYSCKDDSVSTLEEQVTGLHTNGTIVPTSHSQVQGTMFITDQDGNTINGITNSNVSATLTWGTLNPLDSNSNGNVTIVQGSSSKNVAAGVTMDYSGSMGSDQITCMENACTTYVNNMGSSDITEIIKFSTDVEVVQAFTSNKTDLNNAILASWSGAGNSTALYQSIYKATEDVVPQPGNQFIKAVIAFTDGMENASSVTRDQMISQALTNGIPVYTVGLLYFPSSTEAADLQNIADTTGAFYFYSHPDSCTNLNNIYTTISGQLAGAYSITIDWQGTLPNAGTVVTATITTTYNSLTSSFSRSYLIP